MPKAYSDVSDPFTGDLMRVFACDEDHVAEHAAEFLDSHWHDGWSARIVSPKGTLDIQPEQVRGFVARMAGQIAYIGLNDDAGRYFIGLA